MHEHEVLLFRGKAWIDKGQELQGAFPAMVGGWPFASLAVRRHPVIIVATSAEVTVLRASKRDHLIPVSVEKRLPRTARIGPLTRVGPLTVVFWKQAVGLSGSLGDPVYVNRKWQEEIERIETRSSPD